MITLLKRFLHFIYSLHKKDKKLKEEKKIEPHKLPYHEFNIWRRDLSSE